MLYLIAILFPPLAVLLCGKWMQAILNLFLTLAGGVPGMIHAILVVKTHLDDQRAEKMVAALRGSAAA